MELLRPALGLAPVVCYLAALVLLDSYKLVKLRAVLSILAGGMAAAVVCYFLNGLALAQLPIERMTYIRYVAPLIEEAAKALMIVALVRAHRIGFLVDAAIFGFAVGTGFAMVENLQYLRIAPDAGLGTWLVRGFGTAIMHGAASAIFAVMGLALLERAGRWRALLPGFAVAVVLHSAFNHFLLSPLVSTAGVALLAPLLLGAVFERSEASLSDWLGKGFDADTEMLALIASGGLSDSRVGRYLHALRGRFQGPVLADLLSYLRLHTELALRAKGVLMMRESGFEVPLDAATREKFTELRYLEKSLGRTGLLAIHPLLHMSHKDLWQLTMLGK